MGEVTKTGRPRTYTDPTVPTVNVYFRSYQRGAIERNLKFSISRIQFDDLIRGNCHYCGTPPSNIKNLYLNRQGELRSRFRQGDGTRISIERARLASIAVNGLDRIDNNLGYTKENLVSCCYNCNVAKSSHSLEEFTTWVGRLIIHTIFKGIY